MTRGFLLYCKCKKVCKNNQNFILCDHHPVSIRFFPRSRRWPDTPHPLRDCCHTFLPSRSICTFLDLQPNFVHTLFHLLSPCHFWPSSLSLPIHFQHRCLLQYIIIIPSYLTPFAFAISSNVFFKPNISSSSPIFFFYPLISLHTLTSPWLFQFFSKLPFHSPSNTMSHFHITLLILRNCGKPSLSFSEKTISLITTRRTL